MNKTWERFPGIHVCRCGEKVEKERPGRDVVLQSVPSACSPAPHPPSPLVDAWQQCPKAGQAAAGERLPPQGLQNRRKGTEH